MSKNFHIFGPKFGHIWLIQWAKLAKCGSSTRPTWLKRSQIISNIVSSRLSYANSELFVIEMLTFSKEGLNNIIKIYSLLND